MDEYWVGWVSDGGFGGGVGDGGGGDDVYAK
jgi:hypothetical protein